MTVICGGGSSQPKAGLPDSVALDAAGIEAALILFGFPGVAATMAVVLGAWSFYLPTFCATDPPADPNLTYQDVLDALNFGDPTLSIPAIARIRQWFEMRYWYQVCQCTTGATTTPTPSDPGPIGTNTGIPGAPNQPCADNEYTNTFPNPISGQSVTDITGHLLPVSGTTVTRTGSINGNAVSVTAWPANNSISRIAFSSTVLAKDPVYDAANGGNINWITWNAAGTQQDDIGIAQCNAAGGPERTATIVQGVTGFWTTGVTHYAIVAGINHISGATILESAKVRAIVTCSGSPLETPCCPPDPAITGKLDQLYGLLLSVYQSLPTPISSLSEGTAHASLSNSGNFSIAGTTIAVRIDLTTIPGYLGRELGDPLFYFDSGYVTAAGSEGPYASERVTFAQQVFWLPTLSSAIHYSLAPGIVATITELSKGP